MVAYSFRPRFIEPILKGLNIEIDAPEIAPKRQTIRAIGKKRHVRKGEPVHLYSGMRTQHCKLIGVGRCVAVQSIKMNIEHGVVVIASMKVPNKQLDDFARRDGFSSWIEMQMFWREHHFDERYDFQGVIIKWEPMT